MKVSALFKPIEQAMIDAFEDTGAIVNVIVDNDRITYAIETTEDTYVYDNKGFMLSDIAYELEERGTLPVECPVKVTLVYEAEVKVIATTPEEAKAEALRMVDTTIGTLTPVKASAEIITGE